MCRTCRIRVKSDEDFGSFSAGLEYDLKVSDLLFFGVSFLVPFIPRKVHLKKLYWTSLE
jgi:hypothetical protein